MKKCSVCGERKPLKEFRKYVGRSKDGKRPLCGTCQRSYETKWRKRSAEKLRKARWIRSPKAKEYARRYRATNRAAYLVAECRRRCARMGKEFDLDAAALQLRIDARVCEVSGFPLDTTPLERSYERRPNSPSLDRIDPTRGYTMDNVRVVCLAANTAMGNWGEAAFMPIAQAWVEKAK